MNTLLDLQDKLRTTGSAIGRLEAELSTNPSRSVQANFLSMRKLHTSLQLEFAEVADSVGLDVCRYRLLDDRPSARAFAGVIHSFQDVISQLFEAVRTGPRARRNLSAASESMSELQVAYAFPGSFGIVFTIPNSKLLFDIPSQLDKAASAVFDIVTADTSGGTIAEAVKTYGRAPLVAIYEWAKVNADNGIGAGVEWIRGDRTKSNIIIQAPQFGALSQSLERTMQTDSQSLRLQGTLVGANIKNSRFHFVPDGQEKVIQGTFVGAISEVHQVKVPAKYVAVMTKTTEKRLVTEVEVESYFLERLENVPHEVQIDSF